MTNSSSTPALPILGSSLGGTFLAMLATASEAPRQVARADENVAATLAAETSSASATTSLVADTPPTTHIQATPPSVPTTGISRSASTNSRMETQGRAKPVSGNSNKEPTQSASALRTSTAVTTIPIATPAQVKTERAEPAKGHAAGDGTDGYGIGSAATTASLPTSISSGQSEKITKATGLPLSPGAADPPEQAPVSHGADDTGAQRQTQQQEAAAPSSAEIDDQTGAPSVPKAAKNLVERVAELAPEAMHPVGLVLPKNSTLATGPTTSQPGVKAAAKNTSGATETNDAGIANPPDAGRDKTPQPASSTASHGDTGDQTAAPSVANGPKYFAESVAELVPEATLPVALALPISSLASGAISSSLASGATTGQPIVKAAVKNTSGAAETRDAGTANTPDAGKDKTAQSASSTNDTSSSHSQNKNQSSPGSVQADSTQTSAPTTRAEDGTTSQPQTAAAQVVSHQTPSAPHTPEAAGNPVRAEAPRDVPTPVQTDASEPAAASGINTAKLIQTMGETEMRVGVHSLEFGDISIRTSVTQQQMLAQISLDHADLSQAISAHVSTMQTKLGAEYGLHATIEVHDQGSSLSGGSGESSQREQRASSNSVRNATDALPAQNESNLNVPVLALAGSGNRLDVRV